MGNDYADLWLTNPEWDRIQRVIQAAVAYCEGTYPDDHPLDEALRQAVAEVTKND